MTLKAAVLAVIAAFVVFRESRVVVKASVLGVDATLVIADAAVVVVQAAVVLLQADMALEVRVVQAKEAWAGLSSDALSGKEAESQVAKAYRSRH